jgi:biotin operon repressor
MKREFSDLHQTLTLMLILSENSDGLTADDLMTGMEFSRATLSRKIEEARHLGAKIESVRQGRRNLYRLTNWEQIQKTVRRWIALEEQRTLTTQEPQPVQPPPGEILPPLLADTLLALTTLAQAGDVDHMTLRRVVGQGDDGYLADCLQLASNLGAEIESLPTYHYRLTNWQDIQQRVEALRAVQYTRSLLHAKRL